jgi:hypothetical protein
MSAQEARAIFADGKLRLKNEQIWWYAKGYLEALSGKEVQALVEGIQYALDHGSSEDAVKALATFRDQTGSAK